MTISMKDVEHVAKLARLDLTDSEKQQFNDQLNAILKYADKLNQLDTNSIEPTTHVLHMSNVMRPDEERPSYDLDKILSNAPDQEDGQIKVPAILE